MHVLVVLLALVQHEDELSVRLLWARPVVRTDSREYDAGVFSSALHLQDDAGLPERALVGGLELETGAWRFSIFAARMEGDETLASPLAFEEEQFPAGVRLHTTFEAGWFEAVYRLKLPVDSTNVVDVRAILAVNASRFSFDFKGGGTEAHEAHPALWPVPAAGVEGRLALTRSLSMSARFLSTRVRYVNPFHEDGGSDSRIVFDFIRAEAGVEWSPGGGWSLGVGIHRFTNYLRDTSDEDRHRVWFDATSLAFEIAVEF
ncbi:MAG TPA: hypothetical protein VJU16_00800 [Planctomycetota bacterium]|nr:hypothetical protein [Planctomycetota bacterium]